MLKKPLVLLLVSIVVLSVSLQLALRSSFLSEKLIHVTTQRIEKVLGGQASINRARLSLTPTFVEYEGFSLRENSKTPRVVKVDRIRVSLSLYSLLTDVMFIKQISLFNPVIHLTQGGFPIHNPRPLEKDPQSAEKSQKPRFVIREIRIHNGNIRYDFPERSSRVSSEQIDLTIKPTLKMDRFETSISALEVVWKHLEDERKIKDLKTRGVVHPDRVEIETLEFSSLGSSFRGQGSIQNFKHPEVAMTADISIPFEGLHPVFPQLSPLGGNLKISGDFSGVWPDISVRGNLTASGLTFRGSEVGKIQSSFSYKSRKVSLSGITSSVFGGKASGEARFSLEKNKSPEEQNPFSFSLNLQDLNLRKFLNTWGRKSGGIHHRVSGLIQAEGRYSSKGIHFDTVSGNGNLEFRAGQAPVAAAINNPPPKLAVRFFPLVREGNTRFEIQEGLILISEGTLSTPRSSFSFEGEIEPTGDLRLDVDITSREVSELMDLLAPGLLKGSMDMAGRLTGNPADPVFNGTGRARDLSIRGQKFDTVEFGIFYTKNTLRFNQGSLTRDDSRYEVNGDLDFTGPRGSRPSFDLTARITHGSPHQIIPIFTENLPVIIPLTGNITAKGTPKKFKVRGTFKAGRGKIYGQTLDSGQITLELTQKQFIFKDTTAHIGKSVIQGSGRIGFKGTFEFAAHLESVHLQDIAPLRENLAFVEGPVSGTFMGRGTFENPVFEGKLELKNVTISGHPLGLGEVQGTFEDHLLTASGALDAGLTGRGLLKWEPGFPFEFNLQLNQMDLLSWVGTSVPGLTNLSHLNSTGTVHGKGRFRTAPTPAVVPRDEFPVDMTAEVNLQELSAGFKDYVLVNKSPVTLKLKGETATIDSFEFKGEGTSLTVSGSLDFYNQYDILLNGEADLNLLRTFTEEFSYGKGQGKLALQITGPWENPEFRGSLSVKNGTLNSETLRQSLAIRTLELKFNKHTMILEELEAGFGGGLIEATGNIDLIGFLPDKFVLRIGAENIRVKPFEGLSINLDADFDFSGDTESQMLLGEVRILAASYKRRIDFKTWVKEMFTNTPRPKPSSPLLRNVSLKVTVTGSENIAIENNLAQIPLEADLGIKGTLDRPQFGGHFAARGGKFSFQDNEFTIQNGVVEIGTGGTTKTTIEIDLQATTRIRNYDIGLSLVGPLTGSELTFTTSPPLKDQNEIFCLLISKRPCEELKEASREYGTAQASKWVSDEIENLISDKVGKLPGDVDLDTSAISFSKNFLDDKLQVTYASSFDPTKEPEVFLEYFVSNNISLFGGSDEEGIVGADLKFHLEFR